MAPPALQLFPPPPPPNQKKPVQQWPQRTTSRKNPTVTVSDSSPTVERRENGKSPVDLHELVIRVDSPANAAVLPPPPPPPAPGGLPRLKESKKPHIAEPRTTSHQHTSNTTSTPPLPPRAHSVSPAAAPERPQVVVSPTSSDSQVPPGTAVSPPGNVVVSPAGTNVVSATSRLTSSVSPDEKATSPALSGTTARSPTSPPPMRSMFPQYNPGLPLDQQPYKPTQSSPTHIPMSKISRPLYSPTKYTPYANLEHGDEVNMPAPTPYYTPASMLDSLWDATNGQGVPVVQTFTLQMHRHPASKSNTEPQISFGPTPSQPFYTLSHTDIPPGPGEQENDDDDDEHELIIRRHHPTKPTNVPVTHLTLSPTPTMSKTRAGRDPDPASIITTIYPKLAALNALDIASNSPAAAHIAAFDPDATSDAAQRLAEDVLRGTAERECCALVWTRGTSTLPPQHNPSTKSPGTYALHHPTLGVFAISHEGDTSPGLSPVLGSLPFSSRAPSPALTRGNNKPTTITISHPSLTPGTPLAKLDFGADTLVLNISAFLSFSNPYLIDVLVSAILAVALAEEKRLRKAIAFAAPPQGVGMPYSFSTAPGLSVADESKVKRKRLFKFMKSKAGVKAVLPPSHMYKSAPGSKGDLAPAGVVDKEMLGGVEMGSVTAPPHFDGPGREVVGKVGDEERMPFVTRTIVTVLGVGFKTVVWVLSVTFKIVAGVVTKFEMPTELEELVEFLHHGNTQIRQIAAENLVGYSQAQPSIFKTGELTPVKDLKLLVKDYPPIAKNALTILINISDDKEVLENLVKDEAFMETLLLRITNQKEPNANELAMLLANLAKSDAILTLLTLKRAVPSPLSTSANAMDQLMDCFVKGAAGSYNKDADYDYLSYLFADIAKHASGRTYLTTPQPHDKNTIPLTKLQVFTTHPSHTRRLGVASTLKNVAFHLPAHPILLSLPSSSPSHNTTTSSLLPYILEPLMGSEEYPDSDTEGMHDELQLLPPDKQRESDLQIIKLHLETLMLLTTTRAGRDELRGRKVYPVVRELHLAVEDEGVREGCDRFVQVVMRDEEGEEGEGEGEGEVSKRVEDVESGGVVEKGEGEEDDEDDEVIEVL
ncbi:DUF383-domain-containing protein [Pseudovirgaria hyperparasitica]|uniref:Protein HGH1 homolog n=1 Tax=Pseudovirgaria hyperparasitica TaxID=470096 RepID=A0A6A6WGA9_9PEZI|nr:DUF383-domain-containing protein [Pseudovirgaria hyperparasitica]KAF2761104.1 DUF383-domain-containing protein [Pseudovirgaria hyperparasitica]